MDIATIAIMTVVAAIPASLVYLLLRGPSRASPTLAAPREPRRTTKKNRVAIHDDRHGVAVENEERKKHALRGLTDAQ